LEIIGSETRSVRSIFGKKALIFKKVVDISGWH
jgi:hypothetical protein